MISLSWDISPHRIFIFLIVSYSTLKNCWKIEEKKTKIYFLLYSYNCLDRLVLADVLTGGLWDTPLCLLVWERTSLSIFIYFVLRIDYAFSLPTQSKIINRKGEETR